MPVKRRIDKRRDVVISERAVEVFREMKSLARRCVCGGSGDCSACERWWDLHSVLYREIGLPPWCWPVIRETLGRCMDRPWNGIRQGRLSQRDLWRMLDAAAKAARGEPGAIRPAAENGHGAPLVGGVRVDW